ncbi:hypothetical protein GCM10011574_09700 [Microbispora bryophytorum]|uniref:Uncharacterized protein n=1 Tax=Microbispora bryophytorum TaxID=1460882 RepID=A0A8H9GUR9_9ACTN|nr:hypothetical protein GCM10011574_09700 [Microbispora bryophytorum]
MTSFLKASPCPVGMVWVATRRSIPLVAAHTSSRSHGGLRRIASPPFVAHTLTRRYAMPPLGRLLTAP